jgi:hypothetical protein
MEKQELKKFFLNIYYFSVAIILFRTEAPGIQMRRYIPVVKEKDYKSPPRKKLQHILMV